MNSFKSPLQVEVHPIFIWLTISKTNAKWGQNNRPYGQGKGGPKSNKYKSKSKSCQYFSVLQPWLPMSITSKILAQMRSYKNWKKALKVYFPTSPLAAPDPYPFERSHLIKAMISLLPADCNSWTFACWWTSNQGFDLQLFCCPFSTLPKDFKKWIW